MRDHIKAVLTDPETRPSLVSLLIVTFGAVLAFLMFTAIARYLGPEAFGRFATWFNLVSFLAVAGAFGQETLIARSWEEYASAGRWDLVKGALRFGALNVLIGAGLSITALLVLGKFFHADPSLLFAGCCIVIANPLFVFTHQFTRAVIGNLRSDVFIEWAWRLIVIACLLVSALVGFSFGSAAILAMIGGSYLVIAVVMAVVVFPHVPKSVWRAKPETEAKAWRARSLKMWLAALVEASSQYLDVVVVNLLLGAGPAGAYFAASRIANIFARVSSAFETRAASKLSYYYYRKDRVALDAFLRSLARTTFLVVAIGFPCMLVFGRILLPMFADIYAEEFPTLVILTIGTALVTLSGSARLLLLHTGYEGIYMRFISAGLLARCMLFIVLGPIFGNVGIALAWSIASVAVSYFLNQVCRSRLGLDPSVLTVIGMYERSKDVVPEYATRQAGQRVILAQTQAEGAGAQEIARIVGNGLAARGYDVHYVFFFRRTAAFDAIPNTFFCAQSRPSSVGSVVGMLWRYWRYLREYRPASILTFQHYGNIVGAPIARLAGLGPVIANQNTARAQMKPWVVWADRLLGSLSVYSWIVVNSAQTAAEYADAPGPFRKRIVRIDHGFEAKRGVCSKSEARARFKLPAAEPLVGCVARLHPDKNQAAAIRLLAELPQLHLALAGQGADRERLGQLAAHLNVASRLHFVGELSPEQLGEFLRALDAFVFPSRLETFGLAAVEAAQAGVPVVCNDLPVLREVLSIDDKPCAVFVDVEQTPKFAEAVNRVLNDAKLRGELAARGGRLIERYSRDAMVTGYQKLLPGPQADRGIGEPEPAIVRAR